MLLDEDPAALIRETTLNFTIAPDRQALSRINSSLSTLSSTRAAHLQSHQNELRALTRRRTALQHAQAASQQGHDPAAHAAKMIELDNHKFRVAKGAAALEVEAERLEGEVQGVARQAEVVERAYWTAGADVRDRSRSRSRSASGGPHKASSRLQSGIQSNWAGRGKELEDVLRLKLYKGLGVTVEKDKSGRFVRALVRRTTAGETISNAASASSTDRGEVNVMEIDLEDTNDWAKRAETIESMWNAL